IQCNENINSRDHRNGTISSPFYPSPYPPDITCRYIFTGVGRERIQLRFLHMDLNYPSGDPTTPKNCGGSDAVTVYIIINGTTEEIDTWCGRELPQMVMSSQHKMIVEFRSYHSSPAVTGFKAQYSFVTNFGIHEGQQDNRGMCVFNYQSSEKSEGEITSPNYDGLYPRNTECHYLFYGKENERVQIKFDKFDVDGISPRCDERTKSDYVSFSNFANSEDRKMTRLCGQPPEAKRVIWSDGPFFRVIFKSNEIYDSKGFQAHYHFRATDEGTIHKELPPRSREDKTYSVQARRNSGTSGSRPNRDKSADMGGGLLPLAPFISLTTICPVIAVISLHFLPSTFI
ncbi:suppressor of lurcher protein 1, partial [Plakobranchus ocellatus]